MGTIADKLAYLNETKANIKQALINKGVNVADTDTFRSYAEKIASIEGGNGDSYEINAIINKDYSQNVSIEGSVISPEISTPDYIVSASYTETGSVVEFNGNSYTIGTNAFATVQEAINAITEDGKVLYTERFQ